MYIIFCIQYIKYSWSNYFESSSAYIVQGHFFFLLSFITFTSYIADIQTQDQQVQILIASILLREMFYAPLDLFPFTLHMWS